MFKNNTTNGIVGASGDRGGGINNMNINDIKNRKVQKIGSLINSYKKLSIYDKITTSIDDNFSQNFALKSVIFFP